MGKHLRSCGKLVKSPISGAILMDVMSICSVILRIQPEAEDVAACAIASRLEFRMLTTQIQGVS
jgi:hypothetical protein